MSFSKEAALSDGPLQKESLSEQVFHRIRGWIQKNDLQPGDRVPTEDFFCEEYAVSRTTVREAIRILKSFRYVETYRGRGTFVVNPNGDVSNRPGYWFLENENTLRDTLEARRAVEAGAIKLATTKAAAADIARLTELVNTFMRADGARDTSSMSTADMKFHQEIVSLSGNQILVDFHAELMNALKGFFDGVFVLEGIPAISANGHRNIIEAMRAQDANAARRELEEHIETSLQNVERIERTLRRIQEDS